MHLSLGYDLQCKSWPLHAEKTYMTGVHRVLVSQMSCLKKKSTAAQERYFRTKDLKSQLSYK